MGVRIMGGVIMAHSVDHCLWDLGASRAVKIGQGIIVVGPCQGWKFLSSSPYVLVILKPVIHSDSSP